jgi:hypothetical protein
MRTGKQTLPVPLVHCVWCLPIFSAKEISKTTPYLLRKILDGVQKHRGKYVLFLCPKQTQMSFMSAQRILLTPWL